MNEPSQEAKQAARERGFAVIGHKSDPYDAFCEGYDTATAKLREELDESADETWLEALTFLGLEPVVYDMGETREETISHILSLYGRQIEKLKQQLASAART